MNEEKAAQELEDILNAAESDETKRYVRIHPLPDVLHPNDVMLMVSPFHPVDVVVEGKDATCEFEDARTAAAVARQLHGRFMFDTMVEAEPFALVATVETKKKSFVNFSRAVKAKLTVWAGNFHDNAHADVEEEEEEQDEDRLL